MGNIKPKSISFFEKYLSLWVMICIAIGILIGQFLPQIPETLSRLEFANVSLPIALLIWLMIFPMMLKIDFSSIRHSIKQPKGLVITLVINWLIKPAMMFLISVLFFKFIYGKLISSPLSDEYIAGAVLLGAAPCTAMVFVWSHLTKGNPAYTLVQVAINDLIILVAFVPIVAFYLGIGNIQIPYQTLLLSLLLFVVLPLLSAVLSRKLVIKKKGERFFSEKLLPAFNKITIPGLLLTLIIIFAFQGSKIIENPFDIGLIAVPLTIQTLLIFLIGWVWAYWWKLPRSIAAPATLIGASNFFELAVAVAIALFGMESGATLVTVVGVLVEVPIMLTLVKISNKTAHLFPLEGITKTKISMKEKNNDQK